MEYLLFMFVALSFYVGWLIGDLARWIAKNYNAKDKAINFALWLAKNAQPNSINRDWKLLPYKVGDFTIEELYKIYLTQDK